jgi:hypothetical protein
VERVRAGTAAEGVRAEIAGERVVAGIARARIVPETSDEDVVPLAAGQDVAALAAVARVVPSIPAVSNCNICCQTPATTIALALEPSRCSGPWLAVRSMMFYGLGGRYRTWACCRAVR